MAESVTPISLKGGRITWSGMTRLSEQVKRDLRWRMLKNCYVSEDGTEIKSFPGWKLIYDLNYDTVSYAGGSTMRHFHGYKFFSGGVLVVFAEDDEGTEATPSAGQNADSLVAFYVFTRGNITTPIGTISQAWEVANRYVKTHGSWTREQAVLPFKGRLEVLPDRIIMSVPGYSCLFQTFLGSLSIGANNGQEVYTPRALGVPKAVVNETDTVQADSTTSPLGAGLGIGTHFIRVAYRDDATGEVGLASEVFELAVADPTPSVPQTITLAVLMSGEIMPESFALTAMIYASRVDGNKEFMGLVAESGIGAGGTSGDQSSGRGTTFVTNLQWVDADIDFESPPPIFEQMPVGCKATQTVRGFTFYGGFHGDYGHDGQTYLGTLDHDTNVAIDEIMSDVNPADINKQFGLAGFSIPPAYSGAKLDSSSLFASRKTFRMDKMVNKNASSSPPVGINYEVVTYPPSGRGASDSVAELKPERGVLRFSEEAAPGVVPAINRIFVDAARGEDVEALGKLGNSLIICTKTKTFGLAWGRTPAGSDVVKLHDEFGCIAPDSMVEYDGGLAWLSERGPVAISGSSVFWAGMDLKDFFVGPNKRYKSDSRGMMYHSFARHDPDRALVYFGVRRDTHNTNYADTVLTISSYTIWTNRQIQINCSTNHSLRVGDIVYIEGIATDAVDVFLNGFHRVMVIPDTNSFTIVAEIGLSQSSPVETVAATGSVYKNGEASKIACDELLIWSYRNNAWSILEIPDGMAMLSMERIPLNDGEWRMTFMNNVGEIYALDDASVDTLSDTILENHTLTNGSGNTLTFSDASNTANMRVGMHYYVHRTGQTSDGASATDEGVVSRGTISAIASNVITISEAYDRKNGDVVFVGAVPMELESNFIDLGGDMTVPTKMTAVTVRNRWTSKAPNLGLTERMELDMETDGESTQFVDIRPDANRSRFYQGIVRGHETKVTLKIHGQEQFSIQDIELEMDYA